VEAVRLQLQPASATEHVLVISTASGAELVRVQGTVEALRRKAQEGLGLSIPPLAARATAASGGTDRMDRLEEAVSRLTEIAERAERRGLI
jgi:hypothetical protein